MARKRNITWTITDDISGEEIPEDQVTLVKLSFQGKNYELDLGEKSLSKLQNSLSFLSDLTPISGRASAPRSTQSTKKRDQSAIRAWARENGYSLSDRGRVAGEIIAAYDKAH